jgi:RNA polymerase sigma-70 factor (ECF subfamily)
MRRTNEAWIEDLRTVGARQSDALAELRGVLMAGLRRALRGRAAADDALIEDVAQEALVKTLDSLDTFQGRSRFTTWAMAIAVRVAHTELRRRHWRDVSLDQVLEDGGPAHEPMDLADGGPALRTEQTALVEKLHELIGASLTPRQRDALLAELRGMPLEEIGRRMGSNRNATYKLTHDARRKLRAAFEAAGYTAADVQSAYGG